MKNDRKERVGLASYPSISQKEKRNQ